MTLYVACLDTAYCGTTNYELFEAENISKAENYLSELVYENACQYFEVVSVDDYADMVEDENFDDSGYISEDDMYGDIEEYIPRLHNDFLEQYQIDTVTRV